MVDLSVCVCVCVCMCVNICIAAYVYDELLLWLMCFVILCTLLDIIITSERLRRNVYVWLFTWYYTYALCLSALDEKSADDRGATPESSSVIMTPKKHSNSYQKKIFMIVRAEEWERRTKKRVSLQLTDKCIRVWFTFADALTVKHWEWSEYLKITFYRSTTGFLWMYVELYNGTMEVC